MVCLEGRFRTQDPALTHTKTLETRVCVYVSLRLFKECPEGAREPVAKGVKKQYLDDK